ncbi:MAG: PKD domain-containing protein [Bacteroidetes bacterium]|nr:MAG: PKD domain-containing protein [Bacteroidota bacterium]
MIRFAYQCLASMQPVITVSGGKPFLRILFLSLILPLLGIQTAAATHAMGSDLRYECLGGNTYRITLTIYRDCQGSALTDLQNIAFESVSCGQARYIEQATRISITELSPLCPAQQPNSTCSGGILPGVEEHVYELVTTLPAQCTDWRISWHLCCRNYAITNSVITPTTRMYIEAFLDNLTVSCNNSPYFTTPPVPYLCDGEPFLFNNGAIDPDGDSLAFELVDPLDYVLGTPTTIPYQPGFNVNYPMATASGTFGFDPLSGQFSFTPSGLQQGIVAMLVKEYRNGVLIGTTMRDLQMVVLNCFNQVPQLGPPTNVTGGQLNGNTFSLCAGNTLSFDIQGHDPDVIDQLSLTSTLAAAVPGATFNVSGVNPVDGSFSWPTTLADTGTYFFTLTLRDNGCPVEGQQVVGYNIVVRTGELLPAQFETFCPSTDSSLQLNTSIPDTAAGGAYTWQPALGLSNTTIPNPVVSLAGQGLDYTVVYTAPGACPIIEPVRIRPEITLQTAPDPASICLGDSIQLQANVTFNGTGTPPPLTYFWSPAGSLDDNISPSPVAFPTTTTSYVLLLQSLSCAYLDTAIVVVDAPPTLAAIPPGGLCAGDSLQLQASGSSLGSASYSWFPLSGLDDPGSLTPVASPTSNTTYTLTATNACGADTTSVPVTVFPPLNVQLSAQDVNCNGANDGAISVVSLGGAGGFTYTWMPALGNGPSLTNLPVGTYTVMVGDTANCRDTATVTLTQPPALTVAVDSVVNVTCAGASTGSITVTGSGGTGNLLYALDAGPFIQQNTFGNLPAGAYTVSVRDDNGCLATSNFIAISEPTSPVVLALDSVANANCNSPFGALEVSASGGNPGYFYTLIGFSGTTVQNSGLFTGLNPGQYPVIVTDTLGCTDTLDAEITEVADPSATIDSIGMVLCYGGNDGFVQVTGSSGSPPYQFTLDGGTQAQPGPTALFGNLSAGPHEVGLQDAAGCRYLLNLFITQPDSLYGEIGNTTDPDCAGEATGSAVILGFGGVPPYQYGSPPSFNNQITNLTVGTYAFPIVDANNCSTVVVVTLNEPAPLQGLIADQENIRCFGEASGVLEFSALGGTPDFQYSFQGSPFLDTARFEGLPVGSYSVVVRDENGCLDSLNATLTQPDSLSLEVVEVTDVTCYNGSDGTVRVAGTGGTQPYTYAFDTLTFVNTPLLTGLRAGTYAILLEDANGCLAEDQASITEPDEIVGDVTAIPITCYGDDNGQAEVTMLGGEAPYAYAWTDGQTTRVATNLSPGNHLVLVTDANGCEVGLSTEIVEPPEMVFDTLGSTDVTCFDGADGTAIAVASGGAGDLSYLWSNGASDTSLTQLPAGDYVITVLDTNGCELRETLPIHQPPPIEIIVEDIKDAFCGLPTGEITVSVMGGTPGYDLRWDTDPPQTGLMATDLMGGDDFSPYRVTVIDTVGCEEVLDIDVGVEGTPTAAFYTSFAPLDSLLFPDEPVQFFNISEGASAYIWDFGDGGASSDFAPSHAYRDTGTYAVQLVAFDANFLCPDTTVVEFTLLPPGVIYVPNAFSPNGDGINDNFFPKGVGVDWVRMRIYSRWGLHIATLTSMDDRWNGYLPEGEPAPEGVYVWVIDAVINDGSTYHRAGTVTLFR